MSYGIIFALSTLVWVGLQGAHGDWQVVADYWPFLVGLMLVAGMSFVDDIISLPDSVPFENLRVNCGSTMQRLVSLSNQVGQFSAEALALTIVFLCRDSAMLEQAQTLLSLLHRFYQLGLFGAFSSGDVVSGIIVPALIVLLALIVYVGATNVINFMDGINGITGAYSLAVLIPLALLNSRFQEVSEFQVVSGAYFDQSLLMVVILSVLVFCIFNLTIVFLCHDSG